MLKLNDYYAALLKSNKTYFKQVLPDDELQELSLSASEDFAEDAVMLNELIGKLALQQSREESELILVEIIAVVSGMEGLLSNISDDARDLLRGQYRLNDDTKQ